MSLHGSKTIHIAPQGFERARVYEPILKYKPDKVILVTHEERPMPEKARNCKADVQRELVQVDIEPIYEDCDFFDLQDTLWKIGEIINGHPNDDLFVNVSTGSKITAIGGMIACLATHATPYYVRASDYEGETIATGVETIDQLPQYPLRIPHEQYLKVLRFIDDNEPIKQEILEFTEDLPLLSKYDIKDEKNRYKPLNEEILNPLQESGYINETYLGGKKHVTLTEDGEEAMEVLAFMAKSEIQ